MDWPGTPSLFDPGWWRCEVITPPVYNGTASFVDGSTHLSDFSATYRGNPIVPLPGQLVSGDAFDPGTTILADPPPTAVAFDISQPAIETGTGRITIGTEPTSVAECKQYARIQYASQDNLIAKMIEKARRLAETTIKRAIVLQSRCIYFMGFPWKSGYYDRVIRSIGPNPWWLPTGQGVIQLPRPPLQQVLKVEYIDPSSGNLLTVDPATILSTPNSTPGRVMPQYGCVWPTARPVIDSVRITFVCGYGPSIDDVPADVQLGLMGLVASAFDNRRSENDFEVFPNSAVLACFDSERWGGYW